jgi:glycerol-3-phosphate dehydrogenase (NAD(P)+)
MRVTVLGTGAWGTTLADLLTDNHQDVLRWSRRSPQPLSEAIAQAEVLVSAISMKGVADIAQQVKPLSIQPAVVIVSATKGLAPGAGGLTDGLTDGLAASLPDRPSQIWSRALPHNPVVILSGPNLSKEIQQGLPAAAVASSVSESAAIVVQTLFNSQRFRVYSNADPIGVELAGALKNVMAIATGACDGLALGTNARSALMTRGLAEMVRIAVGWGAQAETLYGLAGVGDLMATCSSPLSRNYQVGYRLAQGETIDQVLSTLEGTAEGLNTTQVLMQLVRSQCDPQAIELPITEQVDRLIQGHSTPAEALNALMSRVRKAEV